MTVYNRRYPEFCKRCGHLAGLHPGGFIWKGEVRTDGWGIGHQCECDRFVAKEAGG